VDHPGEHGRPACKALGQPSSLAGGTPALPREDIIGQPLAASAAVPASPAGDSGAALFAALGYTAAWQGRTVVVKFGGSALEAGSLGTLAEDLAALARVGVRPLLVHGGGPEITRLLTRLGKASTFVDGLRVTDAETMEVVEMVLAGRVNKHLVSQIQRVGGTAVGLSGVDGGLLAARHRSSGPDLGFVGEVSAVRPGLLRHLLDDGVVPVIATIGLGDDGERYNLNADIAAAALATALGADKLIVLTDVNGIFAERDGARVLLSEITPAAAQTLIDDGTVSKGMIPKVEACLQALAGGVASAHIVGAGVPHGLLVELLTAAGAGTMIRAAADAARK
jgi:acetylglutamate kinase